MSLTSPPKISIGASNDPIVDIFSSFGVRQLAAAFAV
jgi:hypothetical protein